jgi:hypothetical protein
MKLTIRSLSNVRWASPRGVLCLPLLWALAVLPSYSQTAFTYQGHLLEGGAPANGSYDLRFDLSDAVTNGNYLGPTVTIAPVSVSNGLFTVGLDFGGASFDGSPRWLEIGVRTNTSTGPYTVLVPRQPVTPTPYALFAQTAGAAAVASRLAGGLLGTNAVVGSSLSVVGPQPLYAWAALSNGTVAIPAWNSGATAPTPGLRFFNTNGADMGSIESLADHGGAPNLPVLLIKSSRNIAIIPGLDGLFVNGFNAEVQLGFSGAMHEEFDLQYDDDYTDPNWSDGLGSFLTPNNLGHSKRLQFRSHDRLGNAALPSIIGFSGGDSALVPGYNLLRGTLRFYSVTPRWGGLGGGFSATPGVMVGEMGTNGWNFRGKLVQERTARSIGTATYALDFNQSVCIDLAAAVTNVTFYTTNSTGSPTNYETHTFFIRGGGFSPALLWPPEWSWLGPGSPGSGPTNLPSGQLIRLQLESVGPGESNIMASAQVAADHTFAWDPDALDFIARAGITDPTQTAAVNTLARDYKGNGFWSRCAAIYPFVGGTPQAHAQNLKRAAYTITNTTGASLYWYGAVTHDLNGITGDGISGYGDTGYNPTAAGAATNSFSVFVYNRTATISGDSYPWFIGAADGALLTGLQRVGNTLIMGFVSTVNSDPAVPYAVATTDLRGCIMASRTGSAYANVYFNGSAGTGSATPCTSLPNQNLFLLTINNPGGGHLMPANLAGASIGDGFTQAEFASLRTIWDRFNETLGRSVP